jgi:beta-lactamase class A
LETVLARLDASCTGRLGVTARLITPKKGAPQAEEVHWHEQEQFRTASTVKVAIFAAVLSEASLGRLDLGRRVPLSAADQAGGSGVLSVMQPGLEPTVGDLCTLIIVISDNTATNMLIDLLGGVDSVNRAIRRLGFSDITLHRKLPYPPPPLVAGVRPPLTKDPGSFATATPAALLRLVSAVRAGKVVDGSSSDLIFSTLVHQQYHSGIPRAFLGLAEPGQAPDEWPAVASKTGSVPGCRTEVGVVSLPDGSEFAYAVMADDLADTTMSALSEGDELLGRVGAALLRHWWPGPRPVPLRPGWP